jgi:chromodomain-helicase-DNA-binding protein 1
LNNDSDSDSDYGSRNKKKRKLNRPGELDGKSIRGSRPDYREEGDHYGDDFEDDVPTNGYANHEGLGLEEEHEIESVLAHTRDEGHENDPDDKWQENMVCLCSWMITGC